MFYLPKKKWFRPELDTGKMEDFLNGSRWQLVQTGKSAFALHYAPKSLNMAIDSRNLRLTLKRALGSQVSITIAATPALGPSYSGKFMVNSNRFQK